MDPQPKPDYPTGQEIEDSFKAYKENGATGILEYLKQQRGKREAEDPPKQS